MNALKKKFSILISENDPDYQFLCQIAVGEIDSEIELNMVYSGDQLAHFLQKGKIERELNRQQLPNLIIAHYQPPFFSLDHVKDLRSNDKFEKVPIILLVDDTGDEFRKRALGAGVSDIQLRPYTFHELKEQLKLLVQRFPAKRLTKSLFCCRCEDFAGYEEEHELFHKNIRLSDKEEEFIEARFNGPLCVPCVNQLKTSYKIIHGDFDPGDKQKAHNKTI